MKQTRTFALRPGTAAKVRAFLAEVTRLDSMRRAEAMLLVSELFANAIAHSDASKVAVSVEPKENSVRVSVSHEAPEPLEEPRFGLGFRILDSFAKDWGHDYEKGNLTVWFELRTPGAVTLSPASMDESELLEKVGEDPAYAEELVRRHETLATTIARRYRGKGVSEEDLEQVAMIALMKAIHRFEAAKGELRSFAAVTISGELKRQLRDRGWSVRVPRGLQELAMAVARASQELAQESGRAPTLEEIAQALEVTEEEVAEAMSVGQGYRAASLDEPDPSTGTPMADLMGEVDDDLSVVLDRAGLNEALQSLPERDRLVVYLRFYEDLTQSEIADRIGVSQMHVSRILSRALSELGDILESDQF
ncbi:MAG TPA: sigma-70 family RNA polymerase sigma factor [Acidimicrobiia bacterium]